MHHTLSFRVSLAVVVGALSLGAQAQSASAWTGTWKAGSGALLSVTENAGTLDVWGTDAASVFRLICVVNQKDATQASCVGDGVNHVRGTRFNYRNKLRMAAGAITEDWEAQEFLGSADGRETFKRVATVK